MTVKTRAQRSIHLAVAGGVLFATALVLWADAKANPYLSIVERNPFGLTPLPPPPPPAEAPKPETKPPVQVKLTGITSILSKTKALVEVTEGPGKEVKKYVMVEGESRDNVEVMTINMAKNEVTFKIGDVVTNITFEEIKSAPTPPKPGVPLPGVLPRPGVRPPVPVRTAIAPPPSSSTGPVVVGGSDNSGGSGRSGIVVVGGNSDATPAASSAASARTAVGARPSVTLGTPGAAGGLRTIPSRVPRTPTPTAPETPEDVAVKTIMQYSTMKRTEDVLRNMGVSAPPTPPIPGLDDGPPPDGPPPIPGQE